MGEECPKGRWGLGCQEICPACEHGATCEPETGACLCRPGFTGSRCQDGECCAAPAQPPATPPRGGGWFSPPAPLQLAQQAGLGLAAKRGAPAPMMDTATRPLAAAAAPRGGPVSAAREVGGPWAASI